MSQWNDFNDVVVNDPPSREADEIRAALLARLESVLFALFPAGKVVGRKFFIGDILGSPGRSLEVVLDGEKAGLWIDRAHDFGGDIYELLAQHYRVDRARSFPVVLDRARTVLGRAVDVVPKKRKREPAEDLGPATAKWDYLDANGELIACVYRYDPPGRGKEFRPWDAKRRKMTPPAQRPLYNQPGMLAADTVVLVEGEKTADALTATGVCATTAMHGANAPIEKTDWSPLAGKHVLIWPDKDKPGWDYALRAADAVLEAGALSCTVLIPPSDQPEGWDAADAVRDGADVAAFLAHGERLVVQPAAAEVVGDAATPAATGDLVTEDSLALEFTRRYGRDWRYVATWGQWLGWTGARWQAEHTLCVPHLVRQVCRVAAIGAESPRAAAKLASSSTIAGVERLARSDREHAATTEEWDGDVWKLNTAGGIVDLRTGRLAPHDRTERMTRLACASPKGACPRWLQFLATATAGDSELQAYLARVAGYCLTGSTREHALFFLYGTGANGKSVFVNTLTSLLGDYASNAPLDTFMETRSDRHPTDMAGLRGARVVSTVETEQGRRWAESKLKALTGGDKVSARFMRQDFFEYVPQFKLLVAGNHKPAIRNIDEAMKRRLHLVPFTVTIPPEQRDKDLPKKLLAERDGILAWAVAGCLDWQRAGLQPPACVRDATDDYFEGEDAMGRWIEERCFEHVQARAPVSDLFADWKEWAERAGEFVGSIRRFSEALDARKYVRFRSHGGARGFQGISLRPRTNALYTED